jgi:hypothetical protein
MPFADDATPLIPIPTHQFVLWLFTSYGYMLFLPAIYAISLHVLWDSRNFGLAVLGSSVLIALLTVAWFVTSWSDGIAYPGAGFTKGVAIENSAGIAVAIALSAIGVARSSKQSTATAHLVLFLVLAWCAFPLLGRADL